MRTYHEMVERRNLNWDPLTSINEIDLPSDDLLLEQQKIKERA